MYHFFFPSQTRKLCFFRGVFNRSASFTTIGLLYKNLSLDPTENLQDTSDAFGSDLFMSLNFETELPYLSNPVLTPAVSSSLPESILVPCFWNWDMFAVSDWLRTFGGILFQILFGNLPVNADIASHLSTTNLSFRKIVPVAQKNDKEDRHILKFTEKNFTPQNYMSICFYFRSQNVLTRLSVD